MIVKCLSIQAQNAYAVCLGFKPLENRTWKTDYRGKLYIHSSGEYQYKELSIGVFPKSEQDLLLQEAKRIEKDLDTRKENKILIEKFKAYVEKLYYFYGIIDKEDENIDKIINNEKKCFIYNRAIIGTVDLVDIQHNFKSDWSELNQYQWILENPILFEKPITNVIGKLRLFDFDIK